MDFCDNRPIYMQLADQIMDEVERGVRPDGARLPSVREHAANTGVNANTVMRTYTLLQQEGIIYNQRGIGYFCAPDARMRVHEIRRRNFFDRELKLFMERMAALQITPEEFNKLYTEFLAGRSNPNEASN